MSLDETGWKVAAHLEWLWVAVTPETTVYRIQPGRGFDEAAALIGPDYAGVIVRDGWAPYRQFTAADHQTCLAQYANFQNMPIRPSSCASAGGPRDDHVGIFTAPQGTRGARRAVGSGQGKY